MTLFCLNEKYFLEEEIIVHTIGIDIKTSYVFRKPFSFLDSKRQWSFMNGAFQKRAQIDDNLYNITFCLEDRLQY